VADGADRTAAGIQRRVHQLKDIARENGILFDQISDFGEVNILSGKGGQQSVEDRRKRRERAETLPDAIERGLYRHCNDLHILPSAEKRRNFSGRAGEASVA